MEDSIFYSSFFPIFEFTIVENVCWKRHFQWKKTHFSNFLTNYFLQNNKITKLHTSFRFFFQFSTVASLVSIPKKHLTLISGKKFEKNQLKLQRTNKCVLKCGQKNFPNQFLFLKNWWYKKEKQGIYENYFLLLYNLRVCMRDHLQRCSQYEKIYFPHPRIVIPKP